MADKTPDPTMLYKFPGDVELQDGGYQTLVTDDVDAAKKDGWKLTPAEAKKAAK
jgi:hypothetical protein